jgi:hypothetical protein
MTIYLSAIVLTVAATSAIIGTCMLNGSSTAAAPVHIIQPK